MLGRAPILDFDGTITRLPVDWPRLRADLGVPRLSKLWSASTESWGVVKDAEVAAARLAAPIEAVVEALGDVEAFAIITNNSSLAVHAFVQRFPDIHTRLHLVVGREELSGPKQRFPHFAAAIRLCQASLNGFLEDGRRCYLGDEEYELRFSSDLGLRAMDVRDVVAASAGRTNRDLSERHGSA